MRYSYLHAAKFFLRRLQPLS